MLLLVLIVLLGALVERWQNKQVKVQLELNWQDIWVGVFWSPPSSTLTHELVGKNKYAVYICLVPCLPIRLTWEKTNEVQG